MPPIAPLRRLIWAVVPAYGIPLHELLAWVLVTAWLWWEIKQWSKYR